MKVKSLPGCARLDSRGRLSLRELFGLIVAVLRENFRTNPPTSVSGSQPSGILTHAYAIFPEGKRASEVPKTKMPC